LICSSVPKVFCAGADLKVMHSLLGLWFFSFSQ
jgi:enoyl-CoA hydratase/carnithine racemase